MTEAQKRSLTMIRATLNKIRVCGDDNLGMLLGCIQELDRLIKDEQSDSGGEG